MSNKRRITHPLKRIPYFGLKIKEVIQEGFFLFVGVIRVVLIFVIILVTVSFIIRFVILFPGIMIGGTFHDLLQFTPVQPYTPAVGAIVNFYSLFIAYKKGRVTVGTFHGFTLFLSIKRFSGISIMRHEP
jgi:hypothetical protein